MKTLVSASDPVYSSLSQSSVAGKSSPQLPALSKASLLLPPPRRGRPAPPELPGPPVPAAPAPLPPPPAAAPSAPDVEVPLGFQVSILPENPPTAMLPPSALFIAEFPPPTGLPTPPWFMPSRPPGPLRRPPRPLPEKPPLPPPPPGPPRPPVKGGTLVFLKMSAIKYSKALG